MSVKLQAVANSWKNFELSKTQQELDETAGEIAHKQDESDASRKKLVEQLKEFKKSSSEEARKGSANVIKSFQNEVDFLSKRSKYSELAFLKLYQKFLDIVDPTASLEYAISLEKKVGGYEDLTIENKSIRETLKEYNEELKEVRNQDVTIKNLKEKVRKYEEQIETSINLKIKETEQNLFSSYTEKEQLLLETHSHAIQKLKEAEDRCQMLQQSLEFSQSELFELKNKLEDDSEAKSKEIDIILNDLELANQRAMAFQKELLALKQENKSQAETGKGLQNDDSTMASLELSSLQVELLSKDKEISQLINDVKQLQNSYSEFRGRSSDQISKLEDELNAKKSSVLLYEKQIKLQEDYDDIKRELAIIKSVEFDSIEDLNSKHDSNNVVSKPLELLLLEKNKTLQNDFTALKLLNETLNSKKFELEKENIELKTLTSEQRMLISQLETDLLSVQSIPATHNSRNESVSQTDIISEALRDVTQSESRETTPNALQAKIDDLQGTPSATESLLSIVSAQRERFRYRNEELEADVATKNSQLLLLQNELDSLRGDNLKLYEKIRFLQSYQNTNKTSSENASESRYSNQYENSLDPFMTFSLKEKQRRYASLSPFEKVTLSFGRFVLQNKSARTATFIYVSVLHCLIFLVLYKLAFTESCKRDFSSECAEKFAQHMHDVHGDA